MSSWNQVSVEDIAAPTKSALATGPFGSSIGSKTFRSSGVPVIRGSNLSADVGIRLIEDNLVFIDEALAAKFQRSRACRGDLVFTCWGTINQVGLIDDRASFDRFIVSNKQMKLTSDSSKALPLYLYYFFSSPLGQHEIDMRAIGSSVPGFNLTKLREIEVPLPSLSEQERIVGILGALDDKIDLNRRMNETLETMARAIFKDWFVDFGPVRAKAEGRQPPGLSPEIAALFPDALDDDDKPVGWVKKKISDVVAVGRGASPRPIQDYMGGEVPWLKIADATATQGPFIRATKERIT